MFYHRKKKTSNVKFKFFSKDVPLYFKLSELKNKLMTYVFHSKKILQNTKNIYTAKAVPL